MLDTARIPEDVLKKLLRCIEARMTGEVVVRFHEGRPVKLEIRSVESLSAAVLTEQRS